MTMPATTIPAPHFLLFSEAAAGDDRGTNRGESAGRWRFVLEAVESEARFEVADEEPLRDNQRLELLAVVRGLEALDQPSRVTVITPSRYVSHGFRFGLRAWRENDWQWEKFGELSPIKNHDLWRRIDSAMQFHQIDCRMWQFGSAAEAKSPTSGTASPGGAADNPVPQTPRLPERANRRRASFKRRRRFGFTAGFTAVCNRAARLARIWTWQGWQTQTV